MRTYRSIPLLTPEQVNRFWSRVEVHNPAACWEWTGCLTSGYGVFAIGQNGYMAHRVAVTLLIGPIADGLVVDHLCRNPKCVNPDHIELVSNEENVRRGSHRHQCKNGHPLEGENVKYESRGKRLCRICDNERQRQNYRKRRDAA